MAAKQAILRKKIGEVLYDILPQTSFAQVLDANGKNLNEIVTTLTNSITGVKTQVDNLITDAPEAYDTLKEIGTYIATHQDEYTALQSLVGDKVTKVEGKGLSTEDFTTELKNKLDALYTKAQLDTKFEAVASNTAAIKKLNGDKDTVGSVLNMINTATSGALTDVDTLKQDVATLKGDATTAGSVAKAVADGIAPLTNETTGILAQAKNYTNANAGKVIASTTQPANLTENDLWIYYTE